MFSAYQLPTLVGLLSFCVKSTNGHDLYHYPYYNVSSYSTTTLTLPTTYETYSDGTVTTVISATTVTSSSAIHYPTIHPNTTTITISVPETTTLTPNTTTTTISVPETVVTTTTVYSTTATSTTIIIPTTITPSISYSTYIPTITTSVYNPCPTTCSIAAGTVRLFFWPTNNDYSYPSTYVETALDYTFTSPSVYLVINTIYGTNSLGRAGPSGTSEVFAVDLDQVSTLDLKNQATRQLTLNDLYTNCPQSIAPEVIATTIPDGHCDFSLLAPETVKQWALPCNACGRLGLFDPPYAIPTLAGGLIGTTIATTEVETTTFPSTTLPVTGATSTVVSATAIETTTEVTQTTETEIPSSTGDSNPTTVPSSPTSGSPTSDSPTISSSPASSPTTPVTASATKVTGACGIACLLLSLLVMVWM
ncbi:hypothetical protein HD806DRAFT_503098 [Xylariaceae sp. AK1471]|nr:hypothetical protein HD806DRAFT_503098 [Xylariaceae sp. AK1471]